MRGTTGVIIIIGFAAAVGACGDDDDDGSTSISATASDFQFEPNSWTVSAGEAFSVDFMNEGTVEHEWAVLNLGEDIESEADFAEEKVMFEIEALPVGESTSQEFTVDEPGSYQVICAIPGHFDQGMEGILAVD